MYSIYTDGATSNNGYENARGGYAWVLVEDNKCLEYANHAVDPATNNICELMAIIEACEVYKNKYNEPVVVYSDSNYCINCYKQKWYINWQKNGWINSKKCPVANRNLWEKLIPYFEDDLFTFERVPGHAGIYWNEFVDKLAVQARES